MRFLTILPVLALCLSSVALCQPDETSGTHPGSFDLTIGNTGISFGDGQNMNGIRFAWRDGDFEAVRGINLSFWIPYDNPTGDVYGIALGVLGPGARSLRGISFGVGGVHASSSMEGINIGGLGLVSQGTMTGINIGGLGVVGQGEISGLNVGGLGLVGQGDLAGVNFGGLGTVSQGSLMGVNFGGLGLVSQQDLIGLNFGTLGTVAQGDIAGFTIGGLGLVAQGDIAGFSLAGLGLVAQGSIDGLHIAGLGIVSQKSITGVNVAGIGWVTQEDLTGLSLTLGMARAEEEITGLTVAGYRIKAPTVTGVNIAVGWTESSSITGFTCAAYNRTYGLQEGLVIGLFNHAEDLLGIQIGVLNYVESNPPGLRLLPLFNARF